MSTADPKVGLVLAGGGARGAYEAGALSVLLPALEARGERPGVLLGTSVGAVNTAWLAATAHLDAAGSTESMLDRWRTLGWDAVLGPLVSPFELSRALVYLGELLGVPGAALTSLLDTGPQAATLREQIDFDQLRRNIESGDLQTAAVVATSYATGDSVVFYDRHGGAAAITDDRRRGIRYANSSLAPDHVQASAAIEALFPAIDITAPAKFAGWYGDGGAQLNTPIKPESSAGPYRPIPYIFVAPADRHSVGRVAVEVWKRYSSRLRGRLRERDVALLGKLIDAGLDPIRGELLSYLFFSPEFLYRPDRARPGRRPGVAGRTPRRRYLAVRALHPGRPEGNRLTRLRHDRHATGGTSHADHVTANAACATEAHTAFVTTNRRRPTLPGPCGPSTIGAEGLNGSVRNGKRCFPLAIATGNR